MLITVGSCTLAGELGLECAIPSMAAPLSEGILFDVLEVFGGDSNLSLVAQQMGFRVHPGFKVNIGPGGAVSPLDCMD